MTNTNLSNARTAKNDEFYTQFDDIEKEIKVYLEYNPNVFEGKTILCPCDDPYKSNFFKYFALYFQELKLKKLITTYYVGSPFDNKEVSLFSPKIQEKKTTKNPHKIEITEIPDLNIDGVGNLSDVELLLESDRNNLTRLKDDGDFRSDEITKLRDEADMIVTNPPFSLFREFLNWITEANKEFLIIGNMNAITYKEVFHLIKENKMWLGATIHSGDREFAVPDDYPLYAAGCRIDENGKKFIRVKGVRWFTNLEHGRRHQPLTLKTMSKNLRYSYKSNGKELYVKYDNYDAIEIPATDAIPSDYDGIMGVPISFLDKYCPEQFEILGKTNNKEHAKGFLIGNDPTAMINGKKLYHRILIKHKKF
ncbi:MAG: adenine-specific methyltransferase EcoRI family protein [Marinilabiliaceae bacterium]|nr:adenine-specific methyltransferase EcoRI family protein [Marinilabiliaceae bacterium]